MENKTPLCKQFWLIFEGINKEKSLRYKYKLTENKAIETTGSGKVYKIVDNKVYYKAEGAIDYCLHNKPSLEDFVSEYSYSLDK